MGISISPKSSNPGVKFLHLVTESIPFYNVMRGGRTVKISIYDVVVGDVIPLRIGDQVPADGVLISGHSLAIVRLNGLATFIGIVGLTVALVVLVALLVRLGGFQLVKPWVQQQQFAVIKLEL
ncbi:hypothetical protein YC2023_012839 [Brassica napus]